MAEDLSDLSRDELNTRAEEAGVENPEDLGNKSEVIAAIEEAEGTSTDIATTDGGEAAPTTSSAGSVGAATRWPARSEPWW